MNSKRVMWIVYNIQILVETGKDVNLILIKCIAYSCLNIARYD